MSSVVLLQPSVLHCEGSFLATTALASSTGPLLLYGDLAECWGLCGEAVLLLAMLLS